MRYRSNAALATNLMFIKNPVGIPIPTGNRPVGLME